MKKIKLSEILNTDATTVSARISIPEVLSMMHTARIDVLDRIIANQPLADILLTTIQHLEKLFPAMRASVLQLNARTGCLGACIAPGLPDYYLAAIEGLRPGPGLYSCGTAAYSGETVIVEDVQTHPYWASLRELTARAGFRACTAIPFKGGDDKVLGVVTLYFDHPHLPGDTELELVGEFARMAGIAIEKEKTESQRNEIAAALSQSEARYRSLVEAAPFPVVISRLTDGVLLYGNHRAELMFGISREQGTGTLAVKFYVDPHERARIIAKVLEQQIISDEEIRLYKAGGEIIWVLLSACIMEFDGQPALLSSLVEITERKHNEDKLHEAAAVMKSTHEGVMITDLTPSIVAVNPAFSTITGYSMEEMTGKNPNFLSSGRQDRLFYQTMWQQIQETGHWQGEILNRRKNGEIFPQLLTISSIFNEQQQPIRYVGVFADISELKEHQAQLHFMAHHDALTRLPNRSMVETRLEQEIEQAHRHGLKLAVLFFDLDHFKIVNDSFGHPVGDELLCAVAERLSLRLREGDTLARQGGDEFILLASTLSDTQDAAVVARDIINSLSDPFILSGVHEVFIGCSIGISLFPNDGATVTELMKNADAAMYYAKENGRNQFSFYTKELNADAHSKLVMENDLHRALLNNELQLHYQTKIDLHSGKICGVEALIRWNKPDGTPMSPAEFIPLAEKTGVILTIGNMVLERACLQIRQWLDEGLKDVLVAINISARQFRNGNLDKLIEQSLNKYRIDGRHLELELNENMMMQEPERAIETMRNLKKLGVKLSLDDFGTGYSNLAYLRRFPIDSLKIDQSFVHGMITDPGDAEIANIIIDLAHSLKLSVLAKGVENADQLSFMRSNGCDELQGYLFSRALPASEAAEMMRSENPLII
ncbi:MAG: EAL domain-containing protein [Gallionella sp.]|nr:EAL domain-containing protein [Gallionella sp.]